MRSDEETAGSVSSAIIRLQNGELGAFDELFDRYRRGILAYVIGLVRDRGLAEDIVQEVFLRLVRRCRDIDPKRGASAWLYRVARNLAIDTLRRRKHEVVPENGEFVAGTRDQMAVGSGPDRDLMARERAELVRAALDSVPAKERDVLLLHYYGGLTFQEISKVVRRPLGTVLWQARRAVRRLREQADRGRDRWSAEKP